MSVSKIIKELNCNIIFSSNNVIFQDIVTKRTIDEGKLDGDGTVERHKAKLIVKYYTQTYDIDYQDTFTPVIKMNTIQILLSVAVNLG
jgi:Reverse transcriptase (RNA-dependent DNA polymerase)